MPRLGEVRSEPPSPKGSVIAALDPPESKPKSGPKQKPCPVCGKMMRSTWRYCSGACRVSVEGPPVRESRREQIERLGMVAPPAGNYALREKIKEEGPLKRLNQIVRRLALGMTVQQAAASVGVSDEWYFRHTRAGSEYADLRAKAEAAMIQGRMRIIQQIEKNGKDDKVRLAAATWQLEKIHRKQFGDDRNVTVYSQHNYALSEEKARAIKERESRLLLELNGGDNGNGNDTDDAARVC
jgi:hypothetical protein